MRDRVQVRVSAGEDPSTGERIILTDSVPIEVPGNERSEGAAMKAADTRLLADADELKVVRTARASERFWSAGWPCARIARSLAESER